jgi:hypothetical protein
MCSKTPRVRAFLANLRTLFCRLHSLYLHARFRIGSTTVFTIGHFAFASIYSIARALSLQRLFRQRIREISTNNNSAMAPITMTIRHLLNTRDDSHIPQAPPAAASWGPSSDGWSPSAIIGIVAAIVIILVLVPLIAIILRRYERKRCVELLPDAGAGLDSSKSSVREDQSLKSILVTKEVSRSSLRMAPPGLAKPEEAHTHGRGWSRTEVRGGEWR